jgi:DNA-binding IclR family transcriptional regulator
MNPLSKVFTIIETVIARQEEGATYSDITRESGLPKSSVHRILKDLKHLGYLDFNPATKRYFGSMRFAALGSEILASYKLRDRIHPFLIELQQDTGHTANLGIVDNEQGFFLDKIESRDQGIKLFSEVGKPFPLHCTALGKTLLAFSSESLLAQVLAEPLPAETEKTITDPETLRQELSLIAQQGYAIDNEEITRGIICVAGPIVDFEQRILGAISVAFPAYLSQDRSIEPEISAIKNYAATISRSLGGSLSAVRTENLSTEEEQR